MDLESSHREKERMRKSVQMVEEMDVMYRVNEGLKREVEELK